MLDVCLQHAGTGSAAAQAVLSDYILYLLEAKNAAVDSLSGRASAKDVVQAMPHACGYERAISEGLMGAPQPTLIIVLCQNVPVWGQTCTASDQSIFMGLCFTAGPADEPCSAAEKFPCQCRGPGSLGSAGQGCCGDMRLRSGSVAVCGNGGLRAPADHAPHQRFADTSRPSAIPLVAAALAGRPAASVANLVMDQCLSRGSTAAGFSPCGCMLSWYPRAQQAPT